MAQQTFKRVPEVKALVAIERILAPLTDEAKRRVLAYHAEMIGLKVLAQPPNGEPSPTS